MSDQKRYFGFIREKDGKYGKYLEVGFRSAELLELAKIADESGGWVNLMVSPRREHGPKGQTHNAVLKVKTPTGIPTAPPPAPHVPPPPTPAPVQPELVPQTESAIPF
jgi:hypothetical protein